MPEQPKPKKKGNFLTRKAGPLPVYGWLLIAAGVLIVYYLFFHKPGAQAQSATSAAPSGDLSGQGVPGSAGGASGGGAGGSDQATADLLNAYGQQNANLLSQLQGAYTGYEDLALQAISQMNTAQSSYAYMPTPSYTSGYAVQPGGSNSPVASAKSYNSYVASLPTFKIGPSTFGKAATAVSPPQSWTVYSGPVNTQGQFVPSKPPPIPNAPGSGIYYGGSGYGVSGRGL